MHIPVLLNEVIEALNLKPGSFVIDGTVNGGGHARAILDSIGPNGKLLGIDWDARVLAGSNLEKEYANVKLVNGNYADLPAILADNTLPKADALLLDLGFSSTQLEAGEKGFSFLKDEPLDMTYGEGGEPVHQILRRLDEKELAAVIRDFGEERFAYKIAHAIKERGRKRAIETSGDLAEVIASTLPKGYERGRIHPATRTFQALRIYANHELENVERVVRELPDILIPNGRVAIISFHSLEDRIVKNIFREMTKEKILTTLTKKPIIGTRDEIQANPRSRSAKLRVAKLLSHTT